MNRHALLTCLLLLVPLRSSADWSVFEPLGDSAPPVVSDKEWSAPIDAFVYDRLVKSNLAPAPAADRPVWLRRVTFDLIGLPPAPSDMRRFVNDARPDADAMANVVDRLLRSPRYGERWGRHWLDVVRYADSDGFAIDEERLSLWRYRDYVIRVFNEDRPFDQFIREQIAGDELDLGDAGKVAISFYRLGPWEADNMTPEHRRQDYLNDVTSNVGGVFLGLTIGCARCHDHRFDPILQEDFYRLQAFFTPMQRASISAAFLPDEMTPEIKRRREQTVASRLGKIENLRSKIRKKIADARKGSIDEISDEVLEEAIKEEIEPVIEEDAKQLEALMTDSEHLRPEQRFEPQVVAIRNPKEDDTIPVAYVLNNGDVFDPGEKVTPGFLSEAPVWSEDLVTRATSSDAFGGQRRRLLAEWLTSPSNPITPRVLANRIWAYHFGVGIVATANDFGLNGSGASHPELLDYLARRLLEEKWRLKPLHRELVLSRAYRTSGTHPNPQTCLEKDPDNRLLWHRPPRRLESEVIRDAVLAVSGCIRFEMGGPGFYEALPTGMGSSFPFFKWNTSCEEQRRRRSVYMFQRRNLVHPMMEAFDSADLNTSCERRAISVTAPQALSLFNSQFAYDNCLKLAEVVREVSGDDQACVDQLFWRTLCRRPSNKEVELCVAFLAEKRESYASETTQNAEPHIDHDLRALRDLALAMINTNEFVYVD